MSITSVDLIDPLIKRVSSNLHVGSKFDMLDHDSAPELWPWIYESKSPSSRASFTLVNVRTDPSDLVREPRDQEQNLRSMLRNNDLGDYPFPDQQDTSDTEISVSCDNFAKAFADRERAFTPKDPTEVSQQDLRKTLPEVPRSSGPNKVRRTRKRKVEPSATEKRVKRERFLERNRVAAAKSRRKKKHHQGGLEDKRLELEKENEALKGSLLRLWDTVSLYQDALMAHSGCSHVDVAEWMSRRETYVPQSLLIGTSSMATMACSERVEVDVDSSLQSPMLSGDDESAIKRGTSITSTSASPSSN